VLSGFIATYQSSVPAETRPASTGAELRGMVAGEQSDKSRKNPPLITNIGD
jgi:hypothetical protein